MRVLVVDDGLTYRVMLSRTLKEYGYEVLEAVDGMEALELLKMHDAPQIVILDWIMPKIDGLEILRQIRKIEFVCTPYIIMLTGKNEKNDIVTGLDAGANDYLTKPFDPRELRARVEVGRRMIEMQVALLESREKLAYQATHDSMTGMLNRRAILNILNEMFCYSDFKNNTLTIGMCDIDHFKQINDTYGHQTGDEIIYGLAHIFRENFTQTKYIGRVGGEEFLFIVNSKTPNEIEVIFEKCRKTVAETKIDTISGKLSVTVSIGVASVAGETTIDALLASADSALYQAKKQGRNRVCYA